MEYPKTENLYASNNATDSTRSRGPEFGFRLPSFGQVGRWLVTEKVDGMNMRVIFEPASDEPIRILGRSDRAQIPPELRKSIETWATFPNLFAAFEDEDGIGPSKVILFGEGYGPGIQKAGQAYGGEKRFILFDVVVGESWLAWENVVDVADKLGITTVPVLGENCTLAEAEALIAETHLLPAGSEHVEGIVARTDPYLFDGRGRRVSFKHKVRGS